VNGVHSTRGAVVHTWDSDDAYIADQDKDSSWSHDTAWGECAATKFMDYGDKIRAFGWLYHDDTVADFGGNDGFAAHQFFLRHGIKPLVIDCEPRRLAFAAREYGLKTLRCFIEDIPLPGKSIDWGFCSHTLEHTRDVGRAIAELARVVKRACAFVVPLEKPDVARRNPAHSVGCATLKEWKELLKPHWVIKGSGRAVCRTEGQLFALPRRVKS
jgi:SAM-dependent methyltransferase